MTEMVLPMMNYLRLLGPHVGRIQGRRRPGRPRRASPGRGRRDARAPTRRRRDARAEATRAQRRRPVARARALSTRGRGRTSSRAPPRHPRPRTPRRRPRRQPPPAARHWVAGPNFRRTPGVRATPGAAPVCVFTRRRLACVRCDDYVPSRSRRMSSAPSRRGIRS